MPSLYITWAKEVLNVLIQNIEAEQNVGHFTDDISNVTDFAKDPIDNEVQLSHVMAIAWFCVDPGPLIKPYGVIMS